MGDANTSRASKGKAILEGFYKRAKGEMPDTGEKAPRTGLGLKDRFNALRQSVAPTDPVPMKITDKTPVSEREKEATVIQTSAVRSSGGVRFSDRIGLDVSSGPEGEFERISFDDEDNATLSEQAEDPVRTAHTGKEIKGVPVIFEEDAERTHEVKSSANAVKETVPEKKMSEPAVKAAVNDTEIRTETKEKETFRAPVTEQEVRKEVKADPVITSGDGFDGGYDFLPVRGSSQRSANGNNMRTRPAPVMKDAPAAKQDVPEKKQSTILADRLKARLSPKVKRSSEVQMDAPVQHEGVRRTSLLERVMRDRASSRSVSEVINETEHEVTDDASGSASGASDAIEECDAEISVHDEPFVASAGISYPGIGGAAEEITEAEASAAIMGAFAKGTPAEAVCETEEAEIEEALIEIDGPEETYEEAEAVCETEEAQTEPAEIDGPEETFEEAEAVCETEEAQTEPAEIDVVEEMSAGPEGTFTEIDVVEEMYAETEVKAETESKFSFIKKLFAKAFFEEKRAEEGPVEEMYPEAEEQTEEMSVSEENMQADAAADIVETETDIAMPIAEPIEEMSAEPEEVLIEIEGPIEEMSAETEAEDVTEIDEVPTEEISVEPEEALIETEGPIEAAAEADAAMPAEDIYAEAEEAFIEIEDVEEMSAETEAEDVTEIDEVPTEEISVKPEEVLIETEEPIEEISVKPEEVFIETEEPIEEMSVEPEEVLIEIEEPIEEMSVEPEEVLIETEEPIEEMSAEAEEEIEELIEAVAEVDAVMPVGDIYAEAEEVFIEIVEPVEEMSAETEAEDVTEIDEESVEMSVYTEIFTEDTQAMAEVIEDVMPEADAFALGIEVATDESVEAFVKKLAADAAMIAAAGAFFGSEIEEASVLTAWTEDTEPIMIEETIEAETETDAALTEAIEAFIETETETETDAALTEAIEAFIETETETETDAALTEAIEAFMEAETEIETDAALTEAIEAFIEAEAEIEEMPIEIRLPDSYFIDEGTAAEEAEPIMIEEEAEEPVETDTLDIIGSVAAADIDEETEIIEIYDLNPARGEEENIAAEEGADVMHAEEVGAFAIENPSVQEHAAADLTSAAACADVSEVHMPIDTTYEMYPYEEYIALMEIEGDISYGGIDQEYAHIDTAEEDILALLEGVIVDGEIAGTTDVFFEEEVILPAEGTAVSEISKEEAAADVSYVPAEKVIEDMRRYITEMRDIEIKEIVPSFPKAVQAAEEEAPAAVLGTVNGDAHSVSFSFVSEGTPSPSAEVNFFWGKH